MFENMETTRLKREEREGQEGGGANEEETDQVVHISTLRKVDVADTV